MLCLKKNVKIKLYRYIRELTTNNLALFLVKSAEKTRILRVFFYWHLKIEIFPLPLSSPLHCARSRKIRHAQ